MKYKNPHTAALNECSVRSATEGSLFSMMSCLSAETLQERIDDIKDPATKTLAQAHADAMTDDWAGPIKV